MKKAIKLFSMAALALAMTACSGDDFNNVQKPAETASVLHFEATVAAPADNGMTRTVYVESGTTINVAWKEGDEIYLRNTSKEENLGKVTVGTLAADGSASISGDILAGQAATNDDEITAYYPVLAFEDKTAFYEKFNEQDGTLDYIQNNLDYREGNSKLAVDGDKATLTSALKMKSRIIIWKLTLQDNAATPNALPATKVIVKNAGTVLAATKDISATSTVYLALRNDGSHHDITIEANVGSDTYIYTAPNNVRFEFGKYYRSKVKMRKSENLAAITADYEAKDGEVLTGTLGGNYKISIANGATVTLSDVTINGTNDTNYQWAGISCAGDATIILAGTNKVKGFHENYPGIYVPSGNTLTIRGSGSLDTRSNGNDAGTGDPNIIYGDGAGIGGGKNIDCGNIVIVSGTITAMGGATGIGSGDNASCGNITISGGTITAKGGNKSAGIGGGYHHEACGAITITSGVTRVTATAGSGAPNSIGKGFFDSDTEDDDITVTVGGIEGAVSDSPFTYQPTPLTLTSPTVGQVIGSDNKNYAAGSSLPTGITAVAMIAFLYDDHGLAIALTDESEEEMTWADAKSCCATKAADGRSWDLPNYNQWKAMFKANGGNDEMYTGLNTAISAAGGTVLRSAIMDSGVSDGFYWASPAPVWKYNDVWFKSGGGAGFSFMVQDDAAICRARAVFTF